MYGLAALALAFAAYATSLPGEFVFDDIPLLVESNCHRELANVPTMFDPRNQGVCTVRPVPLASFALDHALWGDWPPGYHLTNVVLHAAVGMLVLMLLLRIGCGRTTALLAASLFLLHPITTEAVAYISGRRDLLMAFFALGAVHAHLSFAAGGWVGWLFVVLGCISAAILSHEIAAALPAALVVLELARSWPADEPRWSFGAVKRVMAALLRRRRLISLGAQLAISVALTLWILGWRDHSQRTELWGGSFGAHVGTVLRMHMVVLKQLLFPAELVADYSPAAFEPSTSLWSLPVLGALVVVTGVLVVGLYALPRRPLIGASVLCHFTLLLPVSQVVVHQELMAEHRLYLPLLCYSALLSAALVALARRARVAWVLAGCAAFAYLGLTNARNLDWRSSLSLWRATVEQVPRCARAQSNLGAALARLRRFDEAERHLELALRLNPKLCCAHANLGALMLDTGRPARGLASLRRAPRCAPTAANWSALGFGALRVGHHGMARNAFRAAVALRPDDRRTLFGLGMTLHRMGDRSGALRRFRQAEVRGERSPKLRYRMTLVLIELCHEAEARRSASRFLGLWPASSAEARRVRRLLRQMGSRCR